MLSSPKQTMANFPLASNKSKMEMGWARPTESGWTLDTPCILQVWKNAEKVSG